MTDDATTHWRSWRARRDEAAFASLVRPEVGRALAFARSLGCTAEDAEDALQDTLARLAVETSDQPERLGVRAWFYRTLKDRARSRRRSWWRSRARERAAARPEAVPAALPGSAVHEEVARALRGLPADDREAVTLRFLQDLDYREMSVVLGVAEEACRQRVHRALERLRSSLGPGAATMIAALPVPGIADGAALVEAALAGAGGTAAATGSGAAAGGIAMASASKVAVGAACAAVGLAAGAGLGSLGGGDAPAPGRGPAPVVAGATDPGGEPPAPVAGGERAAPAGGAAPAASGAPLAAALGDLRPDDEEVAFLRAALAAERERRAAARIDPADGGLDVLRRVRESGAAPQKVLGSFATMASHVRTGAGEVRSVVAEGKDPTPVNLADLAGKSAVVEFGPGTFTFDRRGAAFHRIQKGQAVDSVEIRGAGMDRTTLLLDMDLLHVTGTLRNLRLRDLTLDPGTNGRNALDVRGELAMAMENVRFLGGEQFVHFAGPFYLAAKGCEFLGAGDGLLLAFRAKGLALFEDCVFADLQTVLLGWTGAAAGSEVRFSDCTFENCKVVDSRIEYQGRPEFPVLATGSRVLFGPADLDAEERAKRWGAGWLASAEGTTFAAGAVRCRVSDLLAVLAAAPVPAGEVVLCVRALEVSRAGVQTFAVHLGNPEANSRRTRFFRWKGGVLEVDERRDRGGGPWMADARDVQGLPGLAEIVRTSGIAHDVPSLGIAYGSRAQIEGRTVPTVHVFDPDNGAGWLLHAETGEVLVGGRR